MQRAGFWKHTADTRKKHDRKKKCTVAAVHTEKIYFAKCMYVSAFVFAVYHELITFKIKPTQK